MYTIQEVPTYRLATTIHITTTVVIGLQFIATIKGWLLRIILQEGMMLCGIRAILITGKTKLQEVALQYKKTIALYKEVPSAVPQGIMLPGVPQKNR